MRGEVYTVYLAWTTLPTKPAATCFTHLAQDRYLSRLQDEGLKANGTDCFNEEERYVLRMNVSLLELHLLVLGIRHLTEVTAKAI
jgi:hypothetical protein